MTLDDTLSFAGDPLVFKIDVEGYELEVLAGATEIFGRNYGYAQIECFDEARAKTLIATMAKLGWRWTDHIVDDLIFRRTKT